MTFHHFDTLRDEGEAYVRRLAAVGKLHDAREFWHPHGTPRMRNIVEYTAQQIELRLEATGQPALVM